MAFGSGVSINDFLLFNIMPVTLGNMIAAIIMVAGFYAIAYGSSGDKFKDIENNNKLTG